MKRIVLLLLAVILAFSVIGCSGASDDRMKPTCSYTAYINNKNTSDKNDLSTADKADGNKDLLNTYCDILMSDSVLSKLAEKVDGFSVKELKEMISAEPQKNSEIIKVTVTADTSEDAYNIAAAHAEIAPGKMAEIVEGSSMKIVDYPKISSFENSEDK